MKNQKEYVLKKSSSVFDFTIYILRSITYQQFNDGAELALTIKRCWKYIDPNQFGDVQEFIRTLKLLQTRLGEIQSLAEQLKVKREMAEEGLFVISGTEAGPDKHIAAYAVTSEYTPWQMKRAASFLQKHYPDKNWRLFMLDSKHLQYSMSEYRHVAFPHKKK